MHITRLESFTVALPFQAPILSAFGVSYPARIRTLMRVYTDAGLIGLGETGPSALHLVNREALLRRVAQLEPLVIGHSVYAHAELGRLLAAFPGEAIALEMACWDLIAQAASVPLYQLLGGGPACTEVPIAGYCFFRAPDASGQGAVTLENYVEHCQRLQARWGFQTLKLKLGVNPPPQDAQVIAQLRAAVGEAVELRIDPNGSYSLPTALRMVKRLEPLDLEYIEEPNRAVGPADGTTATAQLRRLRAATLTPIAADHVYRLDLLAQVIRDDAADVVLADLLGCGGVAGTWRYIQMASAFGLGVTLHSGAEICVGQAFKLHLQAAAGSAIAHASDAIYPEYVGGVLAGGKLPIVSGAMAVPQGPGLGVRLDESSLARWELTAKAHRDLDALWQATKAALNIQPPGTDLLVWRY
ncbi:MAG: mandelate racemase/muconate lactonizing enzyme family protein [Anaerolineae bacterium]|nr:mandelate racemase/muconate lactonizing enzyme family protein [Anaerolineae bacterium]